MIRLALGAALAAAGVGCSANASRGPIGETELRVASFNIQAGGGNLENTAKAIHELGADIVGLQEVDVHWSDRSKFADQAAELGRQLGMEVRFAPIYEIANANPTLPSREYGVALLSRFPIARFRNDTLTRFSTQTPNASPSPMPGMLEAMLDVRGRQVRVIVTHLDYRADPSVRSRQVTETLAHLERATAPTILFGDLNATPDAPELRPLFAALADAWSSRPDPGLTYPADKPVKRIDYILVSREFTVRTASAPAVLVSDHRPVVVALAIRNR